MFYLTPDHRRAAQLRGEVAHWDRETEIRRKYLETVRASLASAEKRLAQAQQSRELARHKLARMNAEKGL